MNSKIKFEFDYFINKENLNLIKKRKKFEKNKKTAYQIVKLMNH